MGKKYVSVVAEFSKEGKVTPKALVWDDGRIFEIEKVKDVRRAASLKAGGIGIRYTCSIRGRLVYLFRDDDVWFMEND